MIQVLKRLDQVLDILALRGNQSLGDIHAQTDVKKTTLSNILKSLMELGYVSKENGGYSLGNRVRVLCASSMKKESLIPLAQHITKEVAEKTREGCVCSIFDGDQVLIIAKHVYQRNVTVSADVFDTFSPYGTVSGRTLVAHLPAKERKQFLKDHPGTWGEAEKMGGVEKGLDNVKEEGFAMKTVGDDEVAAMAVPVYGKDGNVVAALGLNLPMLRFKGANKKRIIDELKKGAERMSGILSR